MDCIAVRRRLGLKHRSLRIWTGWAIWVATLAFMSWFYSAYIGLPLSRRSGAAISFTSSFAQLSSGKRLYTWASAHRDEREQSDDQEPGLQPSGKRKLPNADSLAHTVEETTFSTTLSIAQAYELLDEGLDLARARNWPDAIPLLDQALSALNGTEAGETQKLDAAMYALARSYAETANFDHARHWTDVLYATGRIAAAEPAYHLCRRLRETGQNDLAFYYYRLAMSMPKFEGPNPDIITPEPGLHEYLLDYEKSILWSYVGDIGERHSQLHGLGLSIQLLENPGLPEHIRQSVFSNLQYYAPYLRGITSVLRPEKSIDEEWRYSTPTFVDGNTTLIRVVNYYVADDGSYHVSAKAGDHVNTKLVLADTDKEFEVKLSQEFQQHAAADHLLHPDAYILGLEDTRVVRDTAHDNIIFTMSASQQYSDDGRIMKQVLGVLDMDRMTHTVQSVVHSPQHDHVEKNWVFAGGIGHVVYDWYPAIEIGAIDVAKASLSVHTTIPSPPSFQGMRGSTNGVLHGEEWWFVTHAVIHRPGLMRKYLHRLVVLNRDMTDIVRHSLPFTFERGSDVEYCLGLHVDDHGLTFGYSMRDRSSKILKVAWRDVGELF